MRMSCTLGGVAAAFIGGPAAHAQYSIPDANGVTVTFDVQPTPAEYGTGSIPGASIDAATEAALDAAVATVSAADAGEALLPTPIHPPLTANSRFRYNTTGL